MDPMSSMYGGFGNMGMNNGMGMSFNAGQEIYGGWNGQNMWNGGQVNNNPNAFPNSMGNFGPNSGYGYNMSQHPGNFSQMHHQQQFLNHDFQQGHNGQYGRGRGRGRGRGFVPGGYGNTGRGGYSQQMPMKASQGKYEAAQNQGSPQSQYQHSVPQEESTSNDVPSTTNITTEPEEEKAIEEEPVENIEHVSLEGNDRPVKNEADAAEATSPSEDPAADASKHEDVEEKPDVNSDENHFEPVRSILDDDQQNDNLPPQSSSMLAMENLVQSPTSVMAPPLAPLGPSAQFPGDTYESSVRGRGRGSFRAGHRGRGSISNGSVTSPLRNPQAEIPTPVAVEPKGLGVVGAPTGPRAMREGFANAGRGVNIRGTATPSIPAGPRNGNYERR
jgi:hypothetical protein